MKTKQEKDQAILEIRRKGRWAARRQAKILDNLGRRTVEHDVEVWKHNYDRYDTPVLNHPYYNEVYERSYSSFTPAELAQRILDRIGDFRGNMYEVIDRFMDITWQSLWGDEIKTCYLLQIQLAENKQEIESILRRWIAATDHGLPADMPFIAF